MDDQPLTWRDGKLVRLTEELQQENLRLAHGDFCRENPNPVPDPTFEGFRERFRREVQKPLTLPIARAVLIAATCFLAAHFFWPDETLRISGAVLGIGGAYFLVAWQSGATDRRRGIGD
ncbi:MAG: hypothetical protein HZC36_04995 [Armatimonadetes bacterium]|nr:hypothetical protein [Armatimonadota bacterium]